MSGPPTETAPVLPMPQATFQVVEYPGYVKNLDKVLQTLGGMETVERKFADEETQQLELKFRPQDHFSHPIFGDILNTANLLVKVVRRRKKAKNGQPCGNWEIMYDVVGWVNKTARFRGLADFQYIVPSSDPLYQLQSKLENLDMEGIEQFEFANDDMDTVGDNLRTFPPPVFSWASIPYEYNFKQKIDDTKSKISIAKAYVTLNVDQVPSQPDKELEQLRSSVSEEALKRVAALFDARPSWTRFAISCHLPDADRQKIKLLLPLSGYAFQSGPFRDCWFKFGYDPRKDTEKGMLYQSIDFRNVKSAENPQYSRAKRIKKWTDYRADKLNVSQNPQSAINNMSVDAVVDLSEEKKLYLVDGTAYHGVSTIQLIDITDPSLQHLIYSPQARRPEYHERQGWTYRIYIETLREITRKRILNITGRGKEKIAVPSIEDMDAMRRREGEMDEKGKKVEQEISGSLDLPQDNQQDKQQQELNEAINRLMSAPHGFSHLADEDEYEVYEDDDDEGSLSETESVQ